MISHPTNSRIFWEASLVIIILCFSCGNKNQSVSENDISPKPKTSDQKIIIHKDYVYDLSGYEDEGRGKPFNLFDENALVSPNPKIKITTTTSRSPIHSQLFIRKFISPQTLEAALLLISDAIQIVGSISLLIIPAQPTAFGFTPRHGALETESCIYNEWQFRNMGLAKVFIG